MGLGEHGDAHLAAEDPELLDRGRALEVAPDEEGVAALLLEPLGQLAGGGGLARALEAGQQHDRGGLGGVGDLEGLAPQAGDQLLVDDLDDLLGGRQAARQVGADALLADAPDEVLDDLEVDVGLEQGDPDLPQDLFDLALAQPTAALELAEDSLETIAQRLKHAWTRVLTSGGSAPRHPPEVERPHLWPPSAG